MIADKESIHVILSSWQYGRFLVLAYFCFIQFEDIDYFYGFFFYIYFFLENVLMKNMHVCNIKQINMTTVNLVFLDSFQILKLSLKLELNLTILDGEIQVS